MKLSSAIILIFFALSAMAQVNDGRFDASILKEKSTVALSGNWEFYSGQLLTAKDFESYPTRSPKMIMVPSTWNSQNFDGHGVATYRLRLKNLPVDKLLAISIPNVYSSYSLFIDEELIASNGKVGVDKASSSPQWLMKTVIIKPDKPTADLIIHVSNFHHYRGGIHKNILIGDHQELQSIRESEMLAQMMVFSGLIVLSIFFMAMFFIRPKNDYQHILYFSLFCCFWAGRVFFAHIYLRSFFLPDMNWTIAVKLEYVLLYLSLVCGILFLNSVFSFGKSIGFRLMMILNIFFILITTFLTPEIFTALLQVYLALAVINFIYMGYAIVKAILQKKSAAWIGGAAIIVGILVFFYEILAYQMEWALNHIILQSIYLLIFMIISFILAHGFVMQERKIEVLEENQFKYLKGGFNRTS